MLRSPRRRLRFTRRGDPMAARNVVRHRQFCVSYFTLKREFQMSYDNLMG
jgi:hypothetical protein